jgi:hypothetical protein
MKTKISLCSMFILTVLMITACSVTIKPLATEIPPKATEIQPTLEQVLPSATSQPATVQPPVITVIPQGNTVKIPLIAIGDKGASGPKIGCGDSLVWVDRQLTGTDALVQAYTDLLSIKERDYGESGLVDILYQSTLTIKQIYVQGGVATVYLEGSMMLGGECDNPRVQAQLEQTALQFPEVTSVQVFINDKTLAEAISLK